MSSYAWEQQYPPASNPSSLQVEYAPTLPPRPRSTAGPYTSGSQPYIPHAGYSSNTPTPRYGGYSPAPPSHGDFTPMPAHEHYLSPTAHTGYTPRPQPAPYSSQSDYAPVLPPRPYSAQPEYTPVLPPRPYNAPLIPSAPAQPPPLPLPPRPYAGSLIMPDVIPPPTPADKDTPTSPEPKIHAPLPIRPISLSSRPHFNSVASSSTSTLVPTPSDTNTDPTSSTTDLLSASDVRILEEGISAIPAPKRSRSQYPPLKVPIVIPQLSVRSRLLHVMPFTRAHAPIATEIYDIPPADFLRMIDTLNVCVAASPPFQAMHIAAAGVGLVPEPLFIGISLALDGVASAGTRTTKYFRLKRFLEKMNREVWAPRGLQMKILKDPEVVRDILGFDETKLLADMGAPSDDPWQGLPEPLSTRRLRLLGGKVAELDFDVPPPEDRGNIIDKISAKNQARKAERKKRKLYKRQLKHDAKVQMRRHSSAVSLDSSKIEDEERDGFEKKESVGSGSLGSTLVPDAFSGRSERVRSNAMEYDEYSSASSDSDDEDQSARATKLEKAVAKANAKSAKINGKADEKLNPANVKKELSEEKKAKIEQERGKDLEKVQRELDKVKEELEEKREKRLEKRRARNGKRVDKVGKRMQRLEWVVVVNAEAKDGGYGGDGV